MSLLNHASSAYRLRLIAALERSSREAGINPPPLHELGITDLQQLLVASQAKAWLDGESAPDQMLSGIAELIQH